MASLLSTSIASGVDVRHFGEVDLSDFNCTNAQSSFIGQICHEVQSKTVIAELNSVFYAYCDVPDAVLKAWLNAPSKGRYFNTTIKGKYDC